MKNETQKTARIRQLNDELRGGNCLKGQIVITSGIAALGDDFKLQVAKAVSKFDTFTPENDPHQEHDFGSIEVGNHKVFFKIDYYDLELKMHSPDASDPDVTTRVLTIMLAEEY